MLSHVQPWSDRESEYHDRGCGISEKRFMSETQFCAQPTMSFIMSFRGRGPHHSANHSFDHHSHADHI